MILLLFTINAILEKVSRECNKDGSLDAVDPARRYYYGDTR